MKNIITFSCSAANYKLIVPLLLSYSVGESIMYYIIFIIFNCQRKLKENWKIMTNNNCQAYNEPHHHHHHQQQRNERWQNRTHEYETAEEDAIIYTTHLSLFSSCSSWSSRLSWLLQMQSSKGMHITHHVA